VIPSFKQPWPNALPAIVATHYTSCLSVPLAAGHLLPAASELCFISTGFSGINRMEWVIDS